MKVIIEHIYTHERLKFSSLKDLNSWIHVKKSFFNAQSFRIWKIHRVAGNISYFYMFRPDIQNLLQYVKHYKLLNYEQKEKNPRFCSPCGTPISKL